MADSRHDLLQGTLDLLILKVARRGPVHGYAIAQRLQQMSNDVLQVQQGSLYPALHRLERKGLLRRDHNRPRAVNIQDNEPDPSGDSPFGGVASMPTPTFVPVLGRIAAGGPILAEEAVEDGPKPAVEVPSIMGSTFAERAAANKALAERRAESKG